MIIERERERAQWPKSGYLKVQNKKGTRHKTTLWREKIKTSQELVCRVKMSHKIKEKYPFLLVASDVIKLLLIWSNAQGKYQAHKKK